MNSMLVTLGITRLSNTLYSWSTSHPKIWLNVAIVQEKVVKYSQFHVDHKTTEGLKAHGLPVSEYDGGVNMWADSVEDLMSVGRNILFILVS